MTSEATTNVLHGCMYGCICCRKMLAIEIVTGGLTFESGRVVTALGDEKDMAVVVVACVTVGY